MAFALWLSVLFFCSELPKVFGQRFSRGRVESDRIKSKKWSWFNKTCRATNCRALNSAWRVGSGANHEPAGSAA